MKAIENVQSHMRARFDNHQKSAKDALQRIVASATAELARFENPDYMPSTDFIFQYAAEYDAAVERMHATSDAMASLKWLQEQVNAD